MDFGSIVSAVVAGCIADVVLFLLKKLYAHFVSSEPPAEAPSNDLRKIKLEYCVSFAVSAATFILTALLGDGPLISAAVVIFCISAFINFCSFICLLEHITYLEKCRSEAQQNNIQNNKRQKRSAGKKHRRNK